MIGEGCLKHAFCPENHFLLGVQIAYLTIFLPLVFWLVLCGYKIADSGFDLVDGGRYRPGIFRLVAGGLIAVGSAGLLPGFGYWLAFEGGVSTLFAP